MSVEEGILTLVLDGLSSIKDIISDTKVVEKSLKESKRNKKTIPTKTLKCAKELVDTLCERSNSIKKSFYDKYNLIQQKDESSSTKNVYEINKVSNLEDMHNGKVQKDSVNENISSALNGNRNNCETKDPENTNNLLGSCNLDIENRLEISLNDKNITDGNDVSLASKNGPVCSEIGGKKHLTSLLYTTDVFDSSLEVTKESENLTKNKENIDQPQPLPKIKLVDLSKLIDPKPRKSVKFDSSVIILTSSDDEGNSTKKVNIDKDNGVLKSALKSTSNRPNNTIDMNLSKGKHETIKRTRSKDSSDESNSDGEHSLKKLKFTIKLDRIQSYFSNKDNDKASSPSESDDDSSRKSHRLKKREIEKTKNKEKFRSIFKKRHSRREQDAREVKKKEKNKDVIRKLSDTSSSDDSDFCEQSKSDKKKSQTKKHKKEETVSNMSKDTRFACPVYIHLPLIECHKLKEIYLRNKEILEIKKLTNLKSLTRKSSKTVTKVYEKKEKSSEKRKSKRSKADAVSDSDGNQSSDDELSLKSQAANAVDQDITIPIDKDKNMAAITLSELKSSDDNKETGPESSSDSQNDDDDSKKKTTNPKIHKNGSQDKMESDGKEKKDDYNSDVDDKAESVDGDKENSNNKLVENNSKTTESPNEMDQSENIDSVSDQSEPAQENISNDSDEEEAPMAKSKKSKSDSDSKNKEDILEHSKDQNDRNNDTNDLEEDKIEKPKKKNGNDKETVKEDNQQEKQTNSDKSDNENEEEKKEESDSNSEPDTNNKKNNWKKDKLLTEKLDSTDSEGDFSKFCKKKNKTPKDIMRKTKKIKKTIISDSDDSDAEKNKDNSDDESESEKSGSDSKKEQEEEEEEEEKKPSRKRIKRLKNSSSSSDEDKSTRKHIRRLIDRSSLSETTKQAEAEEKERKARIAEKQKKYNNVFEEKKDATIEKIVLEYDDKQEKELLVVNPKLVKKLKPHQANGIRFMWDACFESLERSKEGKGGGCILAHCMGLGKTLQVIALSHTLLTNRDKTGVDKILVVCPVNTVLNWKAEFKKWLPRNISVEVYELVSCKKNYERQYQVNEWHTDGGVMIIGYTMFRNLTNPDNKRLSKKMRSVFAQGFVDPGPDLVVCDEGHLLKNEKTNLSMSMNRIKTLRRIVLTGTPLQNNLREYWCMVQFIKPNLLGTFKEYMNRFVNPITNGQYTDSTQHDIMLMRKRSHVLHKLLDGVVQRRDYAVLEPYLPPKHEYVLFLKLSPVQVKLYKHYMDRYARQNDGSNRTSFLFTDFQQLQRICTHPRVLGDKTSEKRDRSDDYDEEESEGSLRDFIDDGDISDSMSSSNSGSESNSSHDSNGSKKNKHKSKKTQQKSRVTRAVAAQRRENNEESDPEVEEIRKQWWQEYCDGDELDNLKNSGKLSLLFKILKECEEIGDKVLVFSQSLYTLNCIEYFLDKIDSATQNNETEKIGGFTGSWAIGLDYFRLDGSSSCDNRSIWCDQFNNPNNTRARLFLISTKAGGLGINLVAANRVIIFDVSWNPSHDIQSIYRVYRFGQTKPCYIYRFVTYGAMEMKIYERQVTKQAISKRVIDEQQIDRHYNQNDLQELYKCDLEPDQRPIPLVPKDILLGEMLQNYDDIIFKYHIHQSLLENKENEVLNEEERKAAWEEFENEKVLRKTYPNPFAMNANMGMNVGVNMNPQLIATALRNIVKSDNPNWSDVQISGIIPALVQQLQVQMSQNDMSMYIRVQQEIQRMQQEQMREAYYQQQWRALQQQQQRQQALLGNMYIDPRQAKVIAYGQSNPAPPNQAGPSVLRSNEIIELND